MNDIFDLSHCCCVQCVCKKPIKVVGGLPVSIGQPVLADGILVVQFEQEAMPEKPTAMAWSFWYFQFSNQRYRSGARRVKCTPAALPRRARSAVES